MSFFGAVVAAKCIYDIEVLKSFVIDVVSQLIECC